MPTIEFQASPSGRLWNYLGQFCFRMKKDSRRSYIIRKGIFLKFISKTFQKGFKPNIFVVNNEYSQYLHFSSATCRMCRQQRLSQFKSTKKVIKRLILIAKQAGQMIFKQCMRCFTFKVIIFLNIFRNQYFNNRKKNLLVSYKNRSAIHIFSEPFNEHNSRLYIISNCHHNCLFNASSRKACIKYARLIYPHQPKFINLILRLAY